MVSIGRTRWFGLLILVLAVFSTIPGEASPPGAVSDREPPGVVPRPVHTYSIVARDPETGEMGVAVQSNWFSVGSIVAWAEAGVGAVATQSLEEVCYGPLGLAMMRAGKTA